MLDAHIIEAIRQEELERERAFEESRRLRLEIPVLPYRAPERREEDALEDQRGPIVIPLNSDIPLREDEAA